MNYLITGCAGFIGYHLSLRLLQENKKNLILGLDNLDDYYSVKLKNERLKELKKFKNFKFIKTDINNYTDLKKKLIKFKIDIIFHLAAQAGVRYTAINPSKYIDVNLNGFLNLMNLLDLIKPQFVFYASSSSVYGDNKKTPFKESLSLKPKNIYGFTKVSNELFSNYLSKKKKIKFIGLRFFTVFGEWGRPDMFLYKYLNATKKKKTFVLNNSGNDLRDFTYVKDVIEILILLMRSKKKLKNHQIFNICSNKPIKISSLLKFLQQKGFNTKIKIKGKNDLEIFKTHGDNSKIKKFLNYKKFSNFYKSIDNCLSWYQKNYKKF